MAITPAHDSVIDSPTNTFATLDPNIALASTLSDGNLHSSISGINHGCMANFTLPKTGVWYTEFKFHSIPSGYAAVGMSIQGKIGWNAGGSVDDAQSVTYNNVGGSGNFNDVGTAFSAQTVAAGQVNDVSTIAAATVSKVYALCWDADNNKIYLYDGTDTSYADITVNTLKPISFIFAQSSTGTYTISVNFGADRTFGGYPNSLASSSGYSDANGIGDFYYDPTSVVSGALALCTSNLPASSIDVASDDLPEDYFKAVTYTGDGNASGKTITTNLAADFVWIKNRDAAIAHVLFDSVRGVNKVLQSNSTGAEYTDPNALSDFGSSSFSVASDDNAVNESTKKYICWNWRAGGAPSGSNIYMKDGTGYTNSTSDKATVFGSASNYTITPTSASIGVKQGTSVILYTGNTTSGATVPHGLSKAPEFIILKGLDQRGWNTYHLSYGAGKSINIADTSAVNSTANSAYWDSTLPNTSVVTLGYDATGSEQNDNVTYIMYCWHSVEGFSKFGSYTGNGSATAGPFVYTGFKPALVWIKCTSDATTTHTSWAIFDNAREPNNVMNKPLYANQSAAEGERGNGTTDATDIEIDFLSNGFRILTSKEELNDDDETYIFCCWAEMPQKYAVAR